MTNTQKRVLSALLMLSIVIITVILGQVAVKLLVFIIGLLVSDELLINFFKCYRKSLSYTSSMALYMVFFAALAFFQQAAVINQSVLYASLIFNFIAIIYLFFLDFDSKKIFNTFKNFPFVTPLLIALPLLSLCLLIDTLDWRIYLLIMILVNFGMDTGAWFFGKRYGKHKLWKKVSPNKTIEGLIGGIITAAIVGEMARYHTLGNFSIKVLLSFGALALLSQVGDLFESKLKRIANIKDSSHLIPGHGGVYDRVDSLLFLIPYYVGFLTLIGAIKII